MKLLIVDDEIHIVNYIKHLIDWKKIGFGEVYTTNKGTEAKEYILKEKPELIITDVQMPSVSGLELAEIIYENKLSTRIIILSGYSDFSYAQQAIRLGAIDYLIKPIRKNDLLPVVKRSLDTLFSDFSEGLLKVENENKFFINFLSSFPLDDSEEENLRSKKESFFVSWQESPVYRSLKIRANNQYFTICSKEKILIRTNEHYSALTRNNIKDVFFSKYESSEKETYCFPVNLIKFIEEGNWSRLVTKFTKMIDETYSSSYQVQLVIDILKLLGETFTNLHETLNLSDLFSNPPNALEYLKDFFQLQAQKENLPCKEPNYNILIIGKIKEYIKRNFSEEINLDGLGGLVHLHPVTVSRIFKEETAITVMQYLLKIRLDEAAKLLENSNLLVRDIGVLVGYKKTQHFTKLFKERYGETPQNYRRMMQLRGDDVDEF